METPPVIKLNTFNYNSSQLQYHTTSLFSTNNQISYLKPPSEMNSSDAQAAVEDAEISIFDAQKYFNDTSDSKARHSISPSIISTPNHDDNESTISNNIINPSRVSCGSSGYNRVRSFHATPTASSEASWNSQTGLLSHPAGGLAVSLRSLPNSNSNSKNQERLKGGFVSNGSTKWFFRRKCPCSGKKSVQVKEPAANLYTKPQPDRSCATPHWYHFLFCFPFYSHSFPSLSYSLSEITSIHEYSTFLSLFIIYGFHISQTLSIFTRTTFTCTVYKNL